MAANSESLATLEASMRGTCSNMLRLQATMERLQADLNGLHAGADDQAHILVGAMGLRGQISPHAGIRHHPACVASPA